MLLFSCSVMSDSFATPWAVARQGPVSMGFPRQEYWSGLPFLSPGGLPDPGIEPLSPALAGVFFTTKPPGKPNIPSWNNKTDVKFLSPLLNVLHENHRTLAQQISIFSYANIWAIEPTNISSCITVATEWINIYGKGLQAFLVHGAPRSKEIPNSLIIR